MKTFFAVLQLQNKMSVNGQSASLPDGKYYLPVFETREEAETFLDGDKAEIFEITEKAK